LMQTIISRRTEMKLKAAAPQIIFEIHIQLVLDAKEVVHAS